jgi:hypothetical protein
MRSQSSIYSLLFLWSFLACSASPDQQLASDHFLGIWLDEGMEEIRNSVDDADGWSIRDSSGNILIAHTDGREQIEINLDSAGTGILAHDWFFEGNQEPAAIRKYDSLLSTLTSMYGPPDKVDDSPNLEMKSCVWNVEGDDPFRIEFGGLCGIRNQSWEQDGFCKVTVGVVGM